ncbi:MAG: hybrid sensor histidine kinase/response regulator [Opitutaceae bacterium]|nr:hybrid sensor histidine kinase/response regulator [Opitutaceae bacterium]
MNLLSSPSVAPAGRILIVDDNPGIHGDFRKILGFRRADEAGLEAAASALLGENTAGAERGGFTVDSAFQGEEGLAAVERAQREGRPYALAFVDMRMPPGWDGVETIARFWQACPDLQVVICTAYSDYSWDDMIARLGQSDRLLILKKPFDVVEVLQLAHALVAKWRLLQQSRLCVQALEERVRERTLALEGANSTLQAEVADRNRMEIQLRHAQKMESIGQLAAGIAHEINTPTQFIGDNTRFVQDAFGDLSRLIAAYDRLLQAAASGPVPAGLIEEVRAAVVAADMAYLSREIPHAIEQSLEGIARVSNIVRAMKEFSHPGTTEKTELDLNHAIESTLTVCRNEWKYVAELVTHFDPDLPPVPVLPGEFNQVILNIVINATHAIADVVGRGGERKGLITVGTRRDGDWAEVRIGDTGTGIPESARQRIFDPFFTTKKVGQGTGQGLAIAHSVVVRKHGGTIGFETETGRGTTFVIRLPLRSAAAGERAA